MVINETHNHTYTHTHTHKHTHKHSHTQRERERERERATDNTDIYGVYMKIFQDINLASVSWAPDTGKKNWISNMEELFETARNLDVSFSFLYYYNASRVEYNFFLWQVNNTSYKEPDRNSFLKSYIFRKQMTNDTPSMSNHLLTAHLVGV